MRAWCLCHLCVFREIGVGVARLEMSCPHMPSVGPCTLPPSAHSLPPGQSSGLDVVPGGWGASVWHGFYV